MPKDQAGNFHFSSQRAMASDKMGPKAAPAPKGGGALAMKDPSAEPEAGAATELHDKGDGTFHTKTSDGEETDHPHIGHALMHIASKHSTGKHFHAHHDGMGITTHHHNGEGGKAEGPTEHGSSDDAAGEMKNVMDGSGGDQDQMADAAPDDSDMYGKLA